MKKKIVVIGSSSFLGSHCIHHALSHGFHVLGLACSPQTSIPFTPYHWKAGGKKHRLALAELPSEHPSTEAIALINEYQPDYIIDCNSHLLLPALDLLQTSMTLKKYISVLSPEQDRISLPSLSPQTHPIVLLQTALIYGPGQHVSALIPSIILSILLEKKYTLHQDLPSLESFIHIHDVLAGIFQALEEGVSGESYHLSTSDLMSREQLAALICQRLNVPFEEMITMLEAPAAPSSLSCSHKVPENSTFSWHPTIHLEDGLDSVIEWVQEWLPALKNHLPETAA